MNKLARLSLAAGAALISTSALAGGGAGTSWHGSGGGMHHGGGMQHGGGKPNGGTHHGGGHFSGGGGGFGWGGGYYGGGGGDWWVRVYLPQPVDPCWYARGNYRPGGWEGRGENWDRGDYEMRRHHEMRRDGDRGYEDMDEMHGDMDGPPPGWDEQDGPPPPPPAPPPPVRGAYPGSHGYGYSCGGIVRVVETTTTTAPTVIRKVYYEDVEMPRTKTKLRSKLRTKRCTRENGCGPTGEKG